MARSTEETYGWQFDFAQTWYATESQGSALLNRRLRRMSFDSGLKLNCPGRSGQV
jgi:hypothetical protein